MVFTESLFNHTWTSWNPSHLTVSVTIINQSQWGLSHLIYHTGLAATIVNFMSKGTFDSVTLSVCAGCCKTELHAPINNLVVCLDINKKSLASGLVNSKMHNKKNVIICNFNMKNMNQLLAQIHSVSINKGVTFKTNVLFQHPSPSVNGDFKDACISCFSVKLCMFLLHRQW